ncbi:hypothetical protein GCM10020256_22030 [Streptomyces thermocoprophilus]
MQRAVGVLHDVPYDQLLLGAQAERGGRGGRVGGGVAQQLGALRRGELDGRGTGGRRLLRGGGGRARLDRRGQKRGDTDQGGACRPAVQGVGVRLREELLLNTDSFCVAAGRAARGDPDGRMRRPGRTRWCRWYAEPRAAVRDRVAQR